MKHRRHDESCSEEEQPHGFTGFLRGLLAGIPWAERAAREETVTVEAPHGGGLRIHNSNGKTRVTGEDRRDIEVTAYKMARASSEQAAHEAACASSAPARSGASWPSRYAERAPRSG